MACPPASTNPAFQRCSASAQPGRSSRLPCRGADHGGGAQPAARPVQRRDPGGALCGERALRACSVRLLRLPVARGNSSSACYFFWPFLLLALAAHAALAAHTHGAAKVGRPCLLVYPLLTEHSQTLVDYCSVLLCCSAQDCLTTMLDETIPLTGTAGGYRLGPASIIITIYSVGPINHKCCM